MISDLTKTYLEFRIKTNLSMYLFKNYSPLLDLIKSNLDLQLIKKIINYIPLNFDELILKENYKLFLEIKATNKLKITCDKIEKEMFKEVIKNLKIQINSKEETQRGSILEKFNELININK